MEEKVKKELKEIAKESFKENKEIILSFEKGLDKIFQRNHLVENHPLKRQISKLFFDVHKCQTKK